jgi:formylglycine-generating enzyme required for sulfatase activity
MLDESDAVAALQNRLTLYRRTIELLEMQRAQFGAFTPAYIWHQFDDARSAIARIKGELRALGVAVEDHADDAAGQPPAVANGYRAADSQTLLSIYRRMLVDQVRYVPLAGLGAWHDVTLNLTDLYVERTLIQPGSAPANEQPTLTGLLQASGARLLLEGEPGSGRTTCLYMLALACAALAGPASALIADWQEPPPLPILLNAGDITAALARGNAVPTDQDLPTPAAFWSAIERWLKYSELDPLVPTIQQTLDRGGCLVLIDDLDDFPEAPSQLAYVTALARFVARYPDNRYVITCRHDANLTAPLASFMRCQLAPLAPSQIDALAARWYTALGGHGTFVAGDLPERIAMLQGALNGDERLHALAANPRALALCVLVHAEGHELPAERGLILRRLADQLVSGWNRSRSGRQLSAQFDHEDASSIARRQLGLLEALALEFQSRLELDSEQSPVLRYTEIKAILSESRSTASFERRRAGADLVPGLLRWCCRTGLLAPAGPGAYTMPQPQLREYLAARALAALPDVVTRTYGLRHDARWQPTVLLVARELSRSTPSNRAHELLRLLLQPPNTAQGEREHDLLLAAACLVEIGERSPTEQALRAGARERLVRLMEEPTTPIEQRIQAGLLLGRLGDSRFVGLLPPLASVAAGPFMLGSDEGYPDEGPPQLVDVPAFAIGVYPVTVQQYAAFLADSPAQLPPRYWYDPRYNNPACPVVGVTWHDAVAYCTWLTARLRRVGLLPEGMVVRLPLEVEWEKAACWDEQRQTSRRYPWGDEWDSTRANTADGRGAWMTAPVGCYPEGISPYGMHDSIGNVWEWTASEYASYPGAAQFHEAGRYTLRGSSCASNPTHTRCTYRSRLPANYWRYHLGFRIVLGLPISAMT